MPDEIMTYDGPERRMSCACHPKHQRILEDHDKKLETIEGDIKTMDSEIDTKMSSKVFLTLICAFGVAIMATGVAVYRDSQALRLEVIQALNKVEKKIDSQTMELRITHIRTDSLEKTVGNLQRTVDRALNNNGGNHETRKHPR